MDSKMDSGYIPPGDTFEAAFDVCSGLDAAEVLWIMDELFRLEMSFHDGYPLSQNLFTSLHVFRLLEPDNRHPYNFHYDSDSGALKRKSTNEQLVHTVLRAYCIGVIKCIQLSLSMIQAHTFYEEEDFVSYLFGRELLHKTDSQESLRILVEAMDWVDGSDLEASLKFAIKHRLVAREDMLIAMEGRDSQWGKLRSKIAAMEKHHQLAKSVPDAFSDKVQRQLATSTPPRPMPQMDWQDAHQKWLQLCDDILAIQNLTAQSVRQSPQSLLQATWAFAYRDPVPKTYARAKMQEVLTGDDSVAGDISHYELMLTDIRDLVLPGDPLADPESFQIELPTDVRHQASRVIEDFMSRFIGEYLNLFRMICQNRCRTRRTFTQAVPLLDELETEARDADEEINSIVAPRTFKYNGITITLCPLSTWVRFYKLQVTEWVIQLGFETDLYLPSELCTMSLLLGSYTEMRGDILRCMQTMAKWRLDGLKKGGNSQYIEQCKSSLDWYRSAIAMAAASATIAHALHHLYELLEQTEVIDVTLKPYEEPQFRHEARMKPLLNLANDTGLTQGYIQNMRKKTSSPTVVEGCDRARKFVQAARLQLNELKAATAAQAKYIGTEERWKKEVKSLETVGVATTVAISQFARICEKHGKNDLEAGLDLSEVIEMTLPPPGKRYHDWWVVPQLKEK
jgi:hypothetical protein